MYISLLIRIYASLPPHYTSLSLLVVIMAVGMLGLSFAAAILAKDTMSTGNDLVDSHSGSTLGMQCEIVMCVPLC